MTCLENILFFNSAQLKMVFLLRFFCAAFKVTQRPSGTVASLLDFLDSHQCKECATESVLNLYGLTAQSVSICRMPLHISPLKGLYSCSV